MRATSNGYGAKTKIVKINADKAKIVLYIYTIGKRNGASKMKNAVEAVKVELANSKDIEVSSSGEYVVWSELGMIIGSYKNKEDAVDALFSYVYGG